MDLKNFGRRIDLSLGFLSTRSLFLISVLGLTACSTFNGSLFERRNFRKQAFQTGEFKSGKFESGLSKPLQHPGLGPFESNIGEYEKDPYLSSATETEEAGPHDKRKPASLPGAGIARAANESFFEWPVDRARLTQKFDRNLHGQKKRPHHGIDLAAARGTPIYAAHEGRVIFAGSGYRGYGKLVILEMGEWATFYSHLSKIEVFQGENISKGQIIGKMGRTGRASGVHLHFELRRHKKAVDPLKYLP